MNYALSDKQTVSFLLSLLLGAFICIIYDVIRVLHKTVLKGFLEIFVTDILFWLFSAFITFCFLIIYCNGYIRWFVLAGETIGFFVCRITLSRLIFPLFLKIGIIIIAIKSFLSRALSRVFVFIEKNFVKCLKAVKKHLQLMIRLLYNCKPKKRKRCER